MRNLNGCRIVLLLTPALIFLFPIAVITFIFERVSHTLLFTQTLRNWRSGDFQLTIYGLNSTQSNDLSNFDITLQINESPTLAILGVCILAYIVSTIDVCAIWELRRVQGTAKHERGWCWAAIVSNCVMIGVAAGLFGYATSVQNNERGWKGYDDVSKLQSSWTRETWVCQIHKFYSNESWAGPACAITRTTRLLLLPITIASVLVLVSLWMLVNDRGGPKWLFGGKGRYGGFESIYELRPLTPEAPTTQPIQVWAPHPTSQPWPPTMPQQWVPYPNQNSMQQPTFQIPKISAAVNSRRIYR